MPDQWVTLPDTASVSTASASFRINPDTGEKEVSPVIVVRQDGSDSVWLQNLPANFDFFKVYIGMPLKVHWTEEKQGLWSDIEYYDVVEDLGDKINKEQQAK